MTNDTRPIGIFDSGIGGISVLKEMVALMPEEHYIYYGDSAHAPYGTRSAEAVRALSDACVRFLLERDAKAIVIACNTATSAAAGMLRETYPELPIIGIEPALKPAVLWKSHDRVAVMATPMTLKEEKFQTLLHTYEHQATIYSVPAPRLVEFVERGELDSPALESYLRKILTPYLEQELDAIVLGCTHFPFVEPMIKRVAGPSMRIFVGSHGTAMELRRRLIAADRKADISAIGAVDIYNSCTDDDGAHVALCKRLLGNQ